MATTTEVELKPTSMSSTSMDDSPTGWMVTGPSSSHFTQEPPSLQPLDPNSTLPALVRHRSTNSTTPKPKLDTDSERPTSITTTANSPDHSMLLKGKKTEEELRNLKKLGKRGKKLIAFYEKQNELIEELINPNPDVDQEEMEKKLLKLKIALYGSTAVNVLLFGLQLVAAITSGSLALFATMADSFMDLASSIVLLATGAAANRKNRIKYPTGKKRFETAGIIVFSCIMGALSVQLIVEGIKSLVAKDRNVDLTPLSLGLVGFAWLCKVGLYFYCVSLSQFQSARIFAQDHLNDIIFNSFGIILSVLGSYVAWWIDPSGAILIALLILRSWSGTAIEHIQMLVGKSADPAFLSKVTYIAMNHPDVMQVDTVRAYHSGEGFFVEVDIVLPPEMPLYRAHDIGEALQIKIEELGNVERAFVHLDYETTHKPEHKED
ncbi:hypothetical protein HDU97_002960 [Phlyctochytrium planicorne]|nr:hypothetical protein HDU97_002960 [Phlyctochytrium planicorne]